MDYDFIQKTVEDSRRLALDCLHQGKLADYIPELTKADSNAMGVCLLSCDGDYFCAGDVETAFTIQSISKVLALIAALQSHGFDEVFSRVGMEPTGDPFNSFMKLETTSHIPFNPFINAGAFIITSILANNMVFDEVLELASELFGAKVSVNEDVYISEQKSGLRNRSMAYLLSSKGMLSENVEQYLDYYFRLCAIEVNAKQLAHMGLILAFNGKSPLSGRKIADDCIIKIAKTLMLTCGMYDGSGEFAVSAGVPAKSGVGGGIVASSQHRFGIGTFGPALDAKGNSIGGIRAIYSLSDALGLHMFSGRG